MLPRTNPRTTAKMRASKQANAKATHDTSRSETNEGAAVAPGVKSNTTSKVQAVPARSGTRGGGGGGSEGVGGAYRRRQLGAPGGERRGSWGNGGRAVAAALVFTSCTRSIHGGRGRERERERTGRNGSAVDCLAEEAGPLEQSRFRQPRPRRQPVFRASESSGGRGGCG